MFEKNLRWLRAFYPLLITAVILAQILACGKDRHNSRSKISASDVDRAEADSEVDEPSSAKLLSLYGIRSYEQINETLALLTMVNPRAAAIQAVFAEVGNQLPANNDIQSFLASHQVGVSKLATEYCDALINDATLRGQILPGFSFTATPTQGLSGANRANLTNVLLDQFWGSGLESLPDRSDTISLLSELVGDLLTGENQNDPAVTLKVSKGVCTAVLSSASVTIF
jgi:hypothetical protein